MDHQSNIVAIGGGHGLGRVLSALSHHNEHLTGIVTTTDNGGSTGRIRACQGGIAWGDMRNCINQLIATPSIGSQLFEYRFKGSGELNGHNLGNIILTALDNLSVRPLDAIDLIRRILNVTTHILPMSELPADLIATTRDGTLITGETCIDKLPGPPAKLMITPMVPATLEAIAALKQADLILLGPGSFFTSIMPPLLLAEISDAIQHSRAKLVFIANVKKELGAAGEMSLEMMLAWCENALNGRKIDVVLLEQRDPTLPARYLQHVTALASSRNPTLHDRKKLAHAIEQLLVS
ncbi:MAG: uridine diphosphate-N-acetylglucosamine-binding protein YvcK [Vibrionaceae bacterium]